MRRLPKVLIGAVAGIIAIAAPTLASASSVTEHYTGTLAFVNNSASRCLGIAGGKAGIYNCTYQDDQAWQVIATKTVRGSTYAQLENLKGQCLSVSKTRVVGQTCNSADKDQFWNNTSKDAICSTTATPVVNLATSNFVTVAGGATANGSPVEMGTYQNRCNDQFWTLKATLT
jgi:hypothetical protein